LRPLEDKGTGCFACRDYQTGQIPSFFEGFTYPVIRKREAGASRFLLISFIRDFSNPSTDILSDLSPQISSDL
jgi:hypothetical protein